MNDPEYNKLRGIGHLSVLSGWFQQEEHEKNRYVLHLDASFRPERLGANRESEIRFRISLRQCEIVVTLPNQGAGFQIDPRTLARTEAGATVKIADVTSVHTESSGKLDLGAGIKGLAGNMAGKLSGSKTNTVETDRSEEIPRIRAQHTNSIEGDQSWIVTSPLHKLEGVLWSAQHDPRFTLIDSRSPDKIAHDRAKNIPPLALVSVRCKREDVNIEDIEFKDSISDEQQKHRHGYNARLRTAEAFLKTEIQRQNLRVDNVHEPFSDMTLAEYVVPLFG